MNRAQKLTFPALLLSLAVSLACGCPHGDIRVVNVTGVYKGTLEVCIAGTWSGVCADSHSNQEATVACRQLGCANSFVAERTNCTASNTVKFKCDAEATQLLECSIQDSTNCSSSLDMCVKTHCSSCTARSDLLPYGGTHGDSSVPAVDDGSSTGTNLQQPFTFFGSSQTNVYVNTNGAMSFQGSYIQYLPTALPINNTVPLILPFLRDADIRCRGEIYYRVTTSSETLEQASLIVANESFHPTLAFIATWDRVPKYPCQLGTEITNTYQTVLLTDGDSSYICFLYEDIQWGESAQIGFNAGDGIGSFTVPGGLTTDTLSMTSMSNVGRPGVFVYQVNGNEISSPWMSARKQPTQLVVDRIFSTAFELSWNGTQADYYNVYCYYPRCPYCSHLPTLGTIQTRQTEATIQGLYPDTEYACCVTTLSLYGESNCSVPVTTYTRPVPPSLPVNITISNLTSTSVQIAWSPPQYTNGTITHYNVTCYDGFDGIVWLSTTANTSENVSTLKPFTNYTCCVSASNVVGAGNSGCAETRTLPGPPSEPLDYTTVIAAVSGGVVLALMAVIVTFVLICCCLRKSKQRINQQSITEPVYDIPQDLVDEIKIKEPKPTTISQSLQNATENTQSRDKYKEDVEIRYDKPILRSTTLPNTEERKRKPMVPPKHNTLNTSTQPSAERTYQPLIPPKTYKGPAAAPEYQDISYRGGEPENQYQGTNTSEALYDTVGEPEGTNEYEMVPFGGETSPRTEGVYQTPRRSEDASHYQELN